MHLPRTLLLLIVLLLSALPDVSLAERLSVERVTIAGLSFPCAGCELQHTDLGCTLLISRAEEAIPCEQAVPVLVDSLIKNREAERGPDPAQIKQHLVEQRVSPNTAKALLMLLMQTNKGYKLLLGDALQFVKLYEASFTELVLAGKGSPGLWKSLWNLPRQTGAELNVELAAAISLRHPGISLEDLFKRLAERQVKDPTELLSIADVYEHAGEGKTATVIRSMHSMLESCARGGLCAELEQEGLSPAMTEYVQSFRVEQLLRGTSGPGDPVEVLDALASIDKRDRHSAAYRLRLLSTLERARESRLPRVRGKLVTDERLEFLADTARFDRAIAYVLGDILAQAGNEALIEKEVRESLRLLEWSLKVHPEPIEERTTLISRLSGSSALSDVPELNRRFASLVGPVSTVVPQGSDLPMFYWVLLVASLVWLWVSFVVLMRRRKRVLEGRALENEVLQWREERERRDLKKFFALSATCDQEELSKKYRRMAKELHPDSGAGSSQEFAELQEKYERAKEMLFNRRD